MFVIADSELLQMCEHLLSDQHTEWMQLAQLLQTVKNRQLCNRLLQQSGVIDNIERLHQTLEHTPWIWHNVVPGYKQLKERIEHFHAVITTV